MKQINYHSARALTGKSRQIYYLYYNTILRKEEEETSVSLIIRLINPKGAFDIWGFDIKENPFSEVYR